MMNTQSSTDILQLMLHASAVVQGVIILLLATSLASWTIIFSRISFLCRSERKSAAFENEFWSGGHLGQLYNKLQRSPDLDAAEENLFREGFKEYTRLREQLDPDAVMQGVQRSLRVTLMREQERIEAHLPFLASVGSTSTYVGLFGTVWGIMNAFIGLAQMHQATLATVAPGIAEALITTAVGLFAAIPAVLAYNRFNASGTRLLTRYETFADEFSGILHRQVHAGHR